jgi:Glyoxalase/Bleomycin resistance protein/Dioxygenase superfamily
MEVSMSSTQLNGEVATAAADPPTVLMRFEVTVLPVADVDRPKGFHRGLGWRLDADVTVCEDYRVVHVTPPGSPASVISGNGTTAMTPGSVQDLMLIVEDIDAACEALRARGADVSDVWHDETGVFHHAGTTGRVPGPDPHGSSYGSWASFFDPDGNGWLVQEIKERRPGW